MGAPDSCAIDAKGEALSPREAGDSSASAGADGQERAPVRMRTRWATSNAEERVATPGVPTRTGGLVPMACGVLSL